MQETLSGMTEDTPGSGHVEIGIPELTSLMNDSLLRMGLSQRECDIVVRVLLYAELRGKSQGILKILERTVLPSETRTPMQVVKLTESMHRIEGNGNPGMVVMTRAADVTLAAVQRCGIAVTTTRGTSSSTGSIGYYASQLASAGMIGIVFAGSPKVMAVDGAIEPSMGTNPVAFAIPSGQGPILLDMATSLTTWFSVIANARSGVALPDGVAIDRFGRVTTNATDAMQGALIPFGGAKGSGLALMFEILTGPLAGAGIVGDDGDNRGNCLLALDPTLLAPDFISRCDELIDRIRRQSPRDDSSSIRLPGDGSCARAAAANTLGRLWIREEWLTELVNLAGR